MWLRKRKIDTSVPVVVIYRGGIGALAIARSLGRLGVPVYLISQRELSPLWHSRYWVKRFSWDFSAPAEETLAFLRDVSRQIGTRPILLTLADWAAVFIEDHADALQEHFIFPKASPPLIRKLANKWELFRIAQEHGIPTPQTMHPQSRSDVLEYLKDARFPIIMKGADPLLPRAAAKTIVHDRDALLKTYDELADSGPANVVLQEYIPGDAESVWMCNAYFGADSECKAIFTGKKLRQVSDTGIASLAVCLPNEVVARQTRELMQAVGYHGCVGIGWRYDARDGAYKLLDVNARVSGVFRLFRATNGMDVVRVCYLDLTGQPIPETALTVGRKWMLEQDFESSIAAMRRGKLTFKRWLRSLRGVQETHWFAPDDPLPFIVWFWRRARAL